MNMGEGKTLSVESWLINAGQSMEIENWHLATIRQKLTMTAKTIG